MAVRLGPLALSALVLAACARAPSPQAPAPAADPPPPSCLTLRDQELACTVACDPLDRALRRCVRGQHPAVTRPLAHSRVWLRAESDGQGGLEAIRVASSRPVFPAIVEARGCFEESLRRYRYCREPPPRGERFEVPLLIAHPVD